MFLLTYLYHIEFALLVMFYIFNTAMFLVVFWKTNVVVRCHNRQVNGTIEDTEITYIHLVT